MMMKILILMKNKKKFKYKIYKNYLNIKLYFFNIKIFI